MWPSHTKKGSKTSVSFVCVFLGPFLNRAVLFREEEFGGKKTWYDGRWGWMNLTSSVHLASWWGCSGNPRPFSSPVDNTQCEDTGRGVPCRTNTALWYSRYCSGDYFGKVHIGIFKKYFRKNKVIFKIFPRWFKCKLESKRAKAIDTYHSFKEIGYLKLSLSQTRGMALR